MKIVKRNGNIEDFDRIKIEVAIRKANYENGFPINEGSIQEITDRVAAKVEENGSLPVEFIQDYITELLFDYSEELAEAYQDYRNDRALLRESKSNIDDSILGLISMTNKDLITENSNKDAVLISTQRDLMAGQVSKDISRRLILPKHLVKAHDDGLIHIHDMDYLLSPMHNCCLVNLEDMLQNGTVINNKLIEKPKSLRTAATVTSQIIAQVASAQFGGQTISLAHLAPFVEISRQKIAKELALDLEDLEQSASTSEFKSLVERRLLREIKDSVQTIQYQLETLSSTNGQSPFATINLDLGEAKNLQEEKDLALLIEEVLRQRMLGTKNIKGVYVAPAFPKLTYVLDENNTYEGSEYFYLTELAAECSARRLVPDYISAKKMRELKEGNVYPPMGK